MSEHEIRASLRFDPRLLDEAVCTLAETPTELRQASALVHDAYLERGFIAPSPRRLYLGGDGDVAALVLSTRGAVIGTVAITLDRDHAGLPADEIYPDEMHALRRPGRLFVEAGMLAVDRGIRNAGAALLLAVAAQRLTRACGATDIVITVHPAMEAYYRAMMLFERHGDVRTYPRLSLAAATVLLHLDTTRFAERARAVSDGQPTLANPYHLHFVQPLPLGDLSPAALARAIAARAVWRRDEIEADAAEPRLSLARSVQP